MPESIFIAIASRSPTVIHVTAASSERTYRPEMEPGGHIARVIAGIFVLNHPLLAAVTVPTVLIVILGLQGLIMGVFEIFRGFSGGGFGAFILGVFHVLIGLLLLGRPMAAALAVPLVFGVLLLVEGVGLVIWAFRVRA